MLFLKATSGGRPIVLMYMYVLWTLAVWERGKVWAAVSLENPYVLTTSIGIISMSDNNE